MRFRVDGRFVEERERYCLRSCCEQCVHFDALGERCVHGYPTPEHREAAQGTLEAQVSFCKEFELA